MRYTMIPALVLGLVSFVAALPASPRAADEDSKVALGFKGDAEVRAENEDYDVAAAFKRGAEARAENDDYGVAVAF
ncbi:hypothetical protein F5Y03DRAFT_83827 [Xylaria venustula]|nr:hypothetical protein F5Y03DRAFT_83827 [Xylaria venustula]